MSTVNTRKRCRPVLVCNNCHKKKKRCDRNLPCANCIKLNIDDTCSYDSQKEDVLERKKLSPFESTEYIEKQTVPFESSVNHKIERLSNKINELEASITIATLHSDKASNNHIGDKFKIGNRNSSLTKLKASKYTPDSSNSFLFIGTNPVEEGEHIINFLATFHGTSNGIVNAQVSPLGPLRFLVLLRQDPCGNMTRKFLLAHSLKTSTSGGTKDQILCSPNEELEQKSRNFYGTSYIKRIKKQPSIADTAEMKNAISNFSLKLGVCIFSGEKLCNYICLSDQIKHALPNREILSLLVDRFFDSLYPFFPVLDEQSFKSDVSGIIGGDIDNHFHEIIDIIKLENLKDLATSATLLIVLRLSYLSLFSNNVQMNEFRLNSKEGTGDCPKMKFLLNSPIPLETLNVAELCISEFEWIKKPSLEVFQALAMIQIYRTNAPEEDTFRRFESAISVGNLYQMAKTLILNRDPDCLLYIYEKKMDEGTKMLKRRLWYYLIIADIEDSIVYGTPIYTTEQDFDTKPPFIPQDAQTNFYEGRERSLISSINSLHPVIMVVHTILEMIYKVKSDMNISILAKYLSNLEILVQDILGTFNDYLIIDNKYKCKTLKIQKFRLYMYCKIMLLYIYYAFYLYYEEKENIHLSLFYLKKLIAIIFCEMAGVSKEFLYMADTYFGSAFALTVTPILQVFNRMEAVLFQFQIRLNCTQRLVKNNSLAKEALGSVQDDSYIQRLNNLRHLFKAFETPNGDFISTLSSRYYFSWRVKSLLKGPNILFDGVISILDESTTNSAALRYSLIELCDLESLLSVCLSMKTQTNLAQLKNTNLDDTVSNDINRGLSESERCILNDMQVDRLWKVLDLYREELNDTTSQNCFSRIGKKGPSVDKNFSLAQGSDAIANIDIDSLHGYTIYKDFSFDDFFFDANLTTSFD